MMEGDKVAVECPYCRAVYVYSEKQRLPDGGVVCQNCGRHIAMTGSVIVSAAPTEEQSGGPSGGLVAIIAVLVLLFVPLIIAIFVVPLIIIWYYHSKEKRSTPQAQAGDISFRETTVREVVLVICPHCGQRNDAAARKCINCGGSI